MTCEARGRSGNLIGTSDSCDAAGLRRIISDYLPKPCIRSMLHG